MERSVKRTRMIKNSGVTQKPIPQRPQEIMQLIVIV